MLRVFVLSVCGLQSVSSLFYLARSFATFSPTPFSPMYLLDILYRILSWLCESCVMHVICHVHVFRGRRMCTRRRGGWGCRFAVCDPSLHWWKHRTYCRSRHCPQDGRQSTDEPKGDDVAKTNEERVEEVIGQDIVSVCAEAAALRPRSTTIVRTRNGELARCQSSLLARAFCVSDVP